MGIGAILWLGSQLHVEFWRENLKVLVSQRVTKEGEAQSQFRQAIAIDQEVSIR